MTRTSLNAWLEGIIDADDESLFFFEEMDTRMAQAKSFCETETLDVTLYADLCNLQWLWKHLAHTEFDVGVGSDNPCDIFFTIRELAKGMAQKNYKFN